MTHLGRSGTSNFTPVTYYLRSPVKLEEDVLRTLFYERLTAFLFGVAKRGQKETERLEESWPEKFSEMRHAWHQALCSLDDAPVKRTTRSWVSPDEQERQEPRQSKYPIIIAASKLYLQNLSSLQHVKIAPRDIEKLVGSFPSEELSTIAERLGISSTEIKLIFPEIANLIEFISPPSVLRKAHEASRADNTDTLGVEKELTKNAFFLYRCASTSPSIYRCRLDFKMDSSGRLTCTLDDGNGVQYQGMAYTTRKAITAVLVAKDAVISWEMVCLCIGYAERESEWGGLLLGLTDGGHDPCSGRVIVRSSAAFGELKSGPLLDTEWPDTQRSAFLDYVTTPYLSKYALIADRNFLASCQKGPEGIIRKF